MTATTQAGVNFEAELQRYRQRWVQSLRETAPADRVTAEDGVRQAYARAGLKPPEEIIWGRSPMEIERSRKDIWYARPPGRSVKFQVLDSPIVTALKAVRRTPPQTWSSAVPAFAFRTSVAMTTAEAAISRAVERVHWRFSACLQALVPSRGQQRAPFSSFEETRWAQYDHRDGLGLCEFAHDVLGQSEETAALEGLWAVALNAGWMLPHERVCWLSERWEVCNVDGNGRPHSPTGPALAFRDGWRAYFWKGVEVPSWVIEEPERITYRHVDRERNPFVRRCMIEIMTPERYIASGAPHVVAADQMGILWRREWSFVDVWAAVEVVNGTPGPDGKHQQYYLQVPGHMRTPLEAVAWTYGMSPEAYAAISYRS